MDVILLAFSNSAAVSCLWKQTVTWKCEPTGTCCPLNCLLPWNSITPAYVKLGHHANTDLIFHLFIYCVCLPVRGGEHVCDSTCIEYIGWLPHRVVNFFGNFNTISQNMFTSSLKFFCTTRDIVGRAERFQQKD